MKKPDLSFVIPVKDEQASIQILFNQIKAEMTRLGKSFEVIFVDDGSTDQTFQLLTKLHSRHKQIKAIKLRGNFGKSIALQVGFDSSLAEIIFTMDGDLQDDPAEIRHFLDKLNEGFDLVSGWKKIRHDPSIAKVIPSRIVNYLTRRLTGIKIHDTNCGFKAYRREVLSNLNLYGELYRFIPVIAEKQRFLVSEIIIHHRPRLYGQTKFGWGRGIKGLLDLLTIVFLTGYLRRPGHFFGTLGLISFIIGFIIGIYITYIRLTTGTIQYRQPLLFLGMLLMIIGIQLVSTGLLAEMLIHTKQKIDSSQFIKRHLS